MWWILSTWVRGLGFRTFSESGKIVFHSLLDSFTLDVGDPDLVIIEPSEEYGRSQKACEEAESEIVYVRVNVVTVLGWRSRYRRWFNWARVLFQDIIFIGN